MFGNRADWTKWAEKRKARLAPEPSPEAAFESSMQREEANQRRGEVVDTEARIDPGQAHRVQGRIYPLCLLCAEAKLPEPMPEFSFHPLRGWRFDYAWPTLYIAAEIDGGAWTGGRHVRGQGFIEDQRKRNAAVLLGWKVLHYTPDRLGEAITDLKILLRR